MNCENTNKMIFVSNLAVSQEGNMTSICFGIGFVFLKADLLCVLLVKNANFFGMVLVKLLRPPMAVLLLEAVVPGKTMMVRQKGSVLEVSKQVPLLMASFFCWRT